METFAPAQACTAPTAAQPVTLYLGMVEVRNYGQSNAEEILLYPRPQVRISKTKDTGGAVVTRVSTLHRDALGSVRAVTTEAGLKAERAVYRPYGEESATQFSLTTAETKGFIGERFDADAGLQYLNARYYDPKLGMFVQPDWWEVTEKGVGTNRYSYSFGDPVNGKDAEGNYSISEFWDDVKSFFEGFASGATANANLNSTVAGAASGAVTGAAVGGYVGTGVGCAASACGGSVLTGPAGAGGGFILGGLIGGTAGIVMDGLEILGGGITGGLNALSEGKVLSQSDDDEVNVTEPNENDQTRAKPPAGSKPIDKTKWSGDYQKIKAGVGAGPKDDVKIDPKDNVWSENPDGSWTNGGFAGDYTASGRPSGRRGKDRERDWWNNEEE